MIQDEWFDVVDSEDRAQASAPRWYVHQHQLRHRSVHIFVRRPERDEVYLQLRSDSKDQHPNKWDTSCCGHVDRGEMYEVAAWRELDEELALTQDQVHDLQQLFKVKARPETGFEFVQVFLTETNAQPHPEPSEIKEGRWISFDELSGWIEREPEKLAPGLQYLWPRVLSEMRSEMEAI